MTDKTMRRSASVPEDAFSGTLDEEMKKAMGVVYTGASYKIQKEAFEKGKTVGATAQGRADYWHEVGRQAGRDEAFHDFEKEGFAPETTECTCGDKFVLGCAFHEYLMLKKKVLK